MSELYLSRVEIEDFRTFGRFALDIPAGPGLTLLVGTNGLGKSSFFDGIEWCLTDEVRRFSQHISRLKERDYLTRRDAPENSHKVALHFNAGDPIVRTATIKPSEANLVSLLKASGWGEIRNLGTYLAFTHFLGQAAQQRFTSRKHTEQWEALKGPSGIDRLEEIRTTLRGKSTGNAFRRRTEEQKLRIDDAERALLSWRESAERLLRLQRAAAASGAMPQADFDAMLAKLATDVVELTGTVIDPAPKEPSEHLLMLRQVIERESATTGKTVAQLEPLRVVVDRYLSLFSQSDSSADVMTAAKVRLDEATRELSAEILASQTAERSVSEQVALVAREEAVIERLASVRQLIDEKGRIASERSELAGERAAFLSSRAEKEGALAVARPILAKALENQSKRLALYERQAALKEIALRAGELKPLEDEAKTKHKANSAAETLATIARDAIVGIRDEITAINLRIAAGEQCIAELSRKASDMADALARIAGHLDEHDEACPVCASLFSPGVLKALAEAAASSEDAELAEQVRINLALAHELDLKRGALAEAEATIAASAVSSREAVTAQRELIVARTAIARSLDVPVESDLIQVAVERLGSVDFSLASLLASETPDAPSVSAMQTEIAAMEVGLAEILRRSSAVEERYAVLDATILRIDEKLTTFENTLLTASEITRQIEEEEERVAIARSKQTELEMQRTVMLASEVSARERLGTTQAEHDRLAVSIATARREMGSVALQWAKEGFSGIPSQESLATHLESIAAKSASLMLLLETQSVLARTYEAIVAQDELHIIASNMEQQGGVGSAVDPTQHEGVLQRFLSKAREALEVTESTQAAVNAYAGQLKAEADDFSTKFLKPLNDLIDNFNRALLSTPGETVQFSTDLAIDRTQFEMQLRYADAIENALYNTQLPPQLVLSEGQMAANGFSILCAASTAYPWSNWRALLLDDPLQHNDVIHAAAFVDVMRNLVELKGYQLIMSSHDRAESEFLARKFDAAGLPCTVLTLTAPSKEGVRFDPPRYNTAARELMRDKFVRTG